MTRWGTDVLDRLPLRGDETVLDAGCGSGRVTERLVDRLPRGRVVALDGSPSMVEAARERLARFGDRVSYVTADLAAPLPLERRERRRDPVDGDVPLGRGPRGAVPAPRLGPAARRAARRAVRRRRATSPRSGRVLADVGDGWLGPWTFASPEETRAAARGRRASPTSRRGSTTSRRRSSPARRCASTSARSILGAHLERLPARRARRRSSTRSPTRLPTLVDRLRAAQHPRDAGRRRAQPAA